MTKVKTRCLDVFNKVQLEEGNYMLRDEICCFCFPSSGDWAVEAGLLGLSTLPALFQLQGLSAAALQGLEQLAVTHRAAAAGLLSSTTPVKARHSSLRAPGTEPQTSQGKLVTRPS